MELRLSCNNPSTCWWLVSHGTKFSRRHNGQFVSGSRVVSRTYSSTSTNTVYLRREFSISQRQFTQHTWWRHQMETFSALLAICAGNSPVPGEFPSQRPVTRSFDVPLICVWINGWVNNREAGDLRRYRAHYDVTVMARDTIPCHGRYLLAFLNFNSRVLRYVPKIITNTS